jgi:hypothetical protein
MNPFDARVEEEIRILAEAARHEPPQPPCKVHVHPPSDWTRQHWMVVRDDGGLFCSTYFGRTPEGHDARERAELIARAVNEYLDRCAMK